MPPDKQIQIAHKTRRPGLVQFGFYMTAEAVFCSTCPDGIRTN